MDYNDIVVDLNNEFCIINLADPNIENVINNILSCQYILSSSLHGLIVSHAYGIPAIYFKKGYIFGDGSKFIDYFQSVDIPEYSPIEYGKIDFNNVNDLIHLFEKMKQYALPHKDLHEMQQSLIKVAPFSIIDKYKVYLFRNP